MIKVVANLMVAGGLAWPSSDGNGQVVRLQDEITFYQHVAWSADGKHLATSSMSLSRATWELERFAALQRGQFDVQVIPLDRGAPVRAGDTSTNDLWATWWPGERCILYNARSARSG
jgi:hypothetical protein